MGYSSIVFLSLNPIQRYYIQKLKIDPTKVGLAPSKVGIIGQLYISFFFSARVGRKRGVIRHLPSELYQIGRTVCFYTALPDFQEKILLKRAVE